MATYTLTVEVHQVQMILLNRDRYGLCFAISADRDDVGLEYQIIYNSKTICAQNTIKWTDEYEISATTLAIKAGDLANITTQQRPITFGQTYSLLADLSGGVSDDTTSPKNGFKFVNETAAAAIIVSKNIAGRFVTISVRPDGFVPPGVKRLIPPVSVAMWFTNNPAAGSELVPSDDSVLKLDLTNNQSHCTHVTYNQVGVWSVVSNS